MLLPKNTIVRSVFFLTAILFFSASQPLLAQEEVRHYALGTATTGGTYYPVGVAIQALVEARLTPSHNIEIEAVSTGGSAANIGLLRNGEVSFAMVQGLFAREAAAGVGLPADPRAQVSRAELRSVTMLWPDVMHVVVRSSRLAGGTIDDLAAFGGAGISLGAGHSGSRASSMLALGNLGLDPAGLNIVDSGSYDGTVTAFESGDIDGMVMFGGVPISALARLAALHGDEVAFLTVSDGAVLAVNGDLDDLWLAHIIPGGAYAGQTEDVATLAEPNSLLARGDVPADDVYAILKTMFENMDFLASMHPAVRAISLETALAGMTFPLHPGALRFFEEAGIAIPDDLRPPGQ